MCFIGALSVSGGSSQYEVWTWFIGRSASQVVVVDVGGRHAGRRLRHQVPALARLREGDDVADTLRAAEDRDEAVDADSDAAVRRGPAVEGAQQVVQGGGVLLRGETAPRVLGGEGGRGGTGA